MITDFLPVTCDSCYLTFCMEHYPYNKHHCQVPEDFSPLCPVCNRAVPFKRGDDLNAIIDEHIEKNCSVVRTAVFTPCSFLNCKQKTLVPIVCDDCQNIYCITHRHKADHKCKRTLKDVAESSIETKSREVVTSEQAKENKERGCKKELPPNVTEGVLSEEDALAIAIQASLKSYAEEKKHNPPDDKCRIS